MRPRPASLLTDPGEAIRDTSPVALPTGQETTAKTPVLQGSPLWKPNVGFPPSRAACIQRERSVRRNQKFPVEENTARIPENHTGLFPLRPRMVESMLWSRRGLALRCFHCKCSGCGIRFLTGQRIDRNRPSLSSIPRCKSSSSDKPCCAQPISKWSRAIPSLCPNFSSSPSPLVRTPETLCRESQKCGHLRDARIRLPGTCQTAPRYLRIVAASHSKRSRFSGLLGNTYPELRRPIEPNRFSRRQISTRWLARFAGRLNTNSSHGGLVSSGDITIPTVDTGITHMSKRASSCRGRDLPVGFVHGYQAERC